LPCSTSHAGETGAPDGSRPSGTALSSAAPTVPSYVPKPSPEPVQRPADTASSDKPALVSRDELIGLVVDPKLVEIGADQVAAHMGRLGQVRRTQSQESLDFNVGTAAERVELELRTHRAWGVGVFACQGLSAG
jgi:hypothetical protein